MLRLPLFTVLSGYVYALRPVERADVKEFLLGKAKRLLLPLLTIGSLFIIVRTHAPNVNARPELTDLLRAPFYPQAHFWYLHSLFVVFVAIAGLEAGGALDSFGGFALVFAASGYLLLSPLREIQFFGIAGACYLLIFFLWGIGLRRFSSVLESKAVLGPLAAGAVGMIALQQLGLLGIVPIDTDNNAFVSVLGGLCTTAWLTYRGPTIPWLARVGNYSFSIYLMHIFGTAAVRVALTKLGITSDALHVLVGVCAGALLPIVAELVLDRYALTRLLFLGRDYRTPTKAGSDGFSRIAVAGVAGAAAAAAVAITEPPPEVEPARGEPTAVRSTND